MPAQAERHAQPAPELPDWAPRPRKASSSATAQATPQAAARAAPSLPGYPSEEASGGGDLADVDSRRASSRDAPKQASLAKGRAGDATMQQQQGAALPQQQGAGKGTPGAGSTGEASGGVVGAAGAGGMQEGRREAGGALIIAALVAVLAGAVLAAGYAALRQIRRRRQVCALTHAFAAMQHCSR